MLLVLMSLEKCFAVYFPFKSKTVCTVRTAKWATSISGVILVGYNLVYVSGVKPGPHDCVFSGDYEAILHILDSVLYSFGPFVLMFITNFAIVFKFMMAKCRQNNSTESTKQSLSKSATRGTAMVVTVSVTFLILTAPAALREALLNVIYLSRYPIYDVFMYLTLYLNHSINSVLYCIVGSRFRNELFKLIFKKGRCDGISTSFSDNNTKMTTIR